jgi:Ni,Fe-hydrogenase III large subunit
VTAPAIATTSNPAYLANGQSIARDSVPTLPFDSFADTIVSAVADGQRVVALFAAPSAASALTGGSSLPRQSTPPVRALAAPVHLYAVLADDIANRLGVLCAVVTDGRFPSLTPRCPQVHLFEREIAEQFGLQPVGHPWLKPVRKPGTGDFYRVEGSQVHEVAVGPVHAGVIEPGHFRFQCQGEEVFHLEIALGYQYRGVEEAFVGGPNKRSLHYAETVAGDSTIAHTTAYCQALEALARSAATARAQSLRGIALELERVANHVGDLGALAGDVGFLPTASFCGRLRGEFLNLTAMLCGNRFGRGMIQPGGVGFDSDDFRVTQILKRLAAAEKDTTAAVNMLWDTPSVMARFEDTGRLPLEVCRQLGAVGPVARACGVERDARHDQPDGIYQFVHIPVAICDSGDVFARAYVRWLEIQRSLAFVREQIHNLSPGPIQATPGALAPNRLAVSLVEGWRGEVCHVALTDENGRFARYKIVDPSFHNWPALAYVLRGQQISDFPLCNKSFNLSYCGHDL